MKKTFLFSLGLIVAFASLFVSCGDKNNDANIGGTGSGDDVLICKVSVSNTEGGSAKITSYIGASANILIGNGVEVVAVPDDGYNFIGWFVDGSKEPVSVDETFTFIASENITLLAKFDKSFAVSAKSSGGGTVSFKDIADTSLKYVLIGSEVTVIAVPDENCDFLGWFVGDSEEPVSIDATYTFTVSENIALLAKFEVKVNYNGHEYVDLGLPSGLKWATCNIGANSPEEYGGYYAWGETEEKSNYDWSTYKWCNGSENTMTKYCTNSYNGTVDNKTVLDPEDDIAHVKWGGSWRMPTKKEQDELRNKCVWTWTAQNGVNGYRVTAPNGNSIFLPAAGCRVGTDVNYRGCDGGYWSSSLSSNGSYGANFLYFYVSFYDWYDGYRYGGQSVRPVSE